MDSDDLEPKANNREVLFILRTILLGIFGGITYFAIDSFAYSAHDIGMYYLIYGILLTIWALIVGSLAIVFLKKDLRKLRIKGNLSEGPENKFLQVSYYLNIVILIGVIFGIGYFFYNCIR